ncbi:MAG: peroxiredoxin [Cyclobacteriaceae bacterium]|jgi:peroxiredoxin
MFRTSFLISVLLLVVCGCTNSQSTDGLLISGKIENVFGNEQVRLLMLTDEGLIVVDSMEIDADGEFAFRLSDPKPDFYRVEIPGRQVLNLILSGEEDEVSLSLSGEGSDKIEISGSFAASQMLKLDSTARKMNDDVQLLNREALEARSSGDVATVQDITDQYYYLVNKHTVNLKSIIESSVPTLAALYGIEYLDFEQEYAFADSVISLYKADFASHPMAGSFIEKSDAMRRLAIGADAPEINLPTPDGSLLALSSLKGKYVLIDFWAAWCRPCRMENPNVVRMYNQYKDKNFEIYGVSLDRTKDAWLKAIEDDGLIWKHVSDLQYFNSEAPRMYQIKAIPATYLIGPDGKIIGKNLRGPSLEAKLKEIFG